MYHKRPYYLLKVREEAEDLVRRLANKFRITELEAIRQLEDALNEMDQAEVHRQIDRERALETLGI